jgi:hypothetical protein
MSAIANPKKICYAYVEDAFPNGLHEVESTISFPGLRLRIDPYPDPVKKVWGKIAASMRGYVTNHPTRFARKVDEVEAIRFAEYLVEQLMDKEVQRVNFDSLKKWKEDFSEGVYRGTFDPYMYLARALLADPYWYPKDFDPPFLAWNPLPDIDIAPDFNLLEIPTSGNTGFWELESWNDPRRTPEENQAFHECIFQSCRDFKDRIDALPRITPKLVKAVSPPLAGYHRGQGRGRIVFALSKKVAFWLMLITQPLQYILDRARTVWYGGGDRRNRLRQMQAVMNGEPGTHSVDGDDFGVKAEDAIVSGDTTSFDGGVKPNEHRAWHEAIREILPEGHYRMFLACKYAASTADAAINVGMLRKVAFQGVISGCPDTHPEDSWVQSARIMSVNWKKAELGIKHLSRFGIYKPENQYTFDHTITMSQLIVSDAYPNAIFGLIPRAIRALFERESRSDIDTVATEDTRIVQICANLYGMPWVHEKVCSWVNKNWEVRVDLQTIKSILKMSRKVSPTGDYERKALTETYRLLTV